MYIYMDIYFENVKFIVVNLKLDVEQYIIFFYHNFLQTDYDKFYIVRIYMYTRIYTLCFPVILALYRISIIVRYFDILLLNKKYIASRYIFNSVLSIS